MKNKIENNVVVIDGDNVAYHKSSKASLQNLQQMMNFVEKSKKTPYMFVSARLRHVIDQPRKYEDFITQSCVREIPANTDGDSFILESAKQLNAPIVSNDLFRQYKKKYPKAFRSRIPFMIVSGKVIIPQFTI